VKYFSAQLILFLVYLAHHTISDKLKIGQLSAGTVCTWGGSMLIAEVSGRIWGWSEQVYGIVCGSVLTACILLTAVKVKRNAQEEDSSRNGSTPRS
jgi:hypothetical protein